MLISSYKHADSIMEMSVYACCTNSTGVTYASDDAL